MRNFYSLPGVALLLVLLASAPNLDSQTFTKVTTGAIVNEVANSWGCSWGDYNNDGFLDLYVSVNGNDLLYMGDGDTTFTKITTGAVVNDGGDSRGITWGDYDNDGNLDLFVSNNAAKNFLYHNDGPASNYTFTKVTLGDIANDVAGGRGSSWADYDNDGLLDLFVATTANDLLYHNVGGGSFAKITAGAIVTSGGFSIGPAWSDYDNDGDLDLYVANFNSNNFFFQNNGNGSFRPLTGITVNEGGASVGTSWGDYDNDGDFDLFVANITGETNFFYINGGPPLYLFIKVTTGAIVTDAGDAYGSNWVDYDNDGDLDLHVAYVGNDALYQNDGPPNYTFTKITTGSVVNDGGNSYGSCWGDIDNDGDLDVFVVNKSEKNFLYANSGNVNHWINIKCVGVASNKSAIGARVRAKATIGGAPVWQMQEISGQTAYYSQNSLNVEFGFRDAARIDSLVIEWPAPAGSVEVYTNVAADRFITLTQGVSAPPPIGWSLQTSGISTRITSVEAVNPLVVWAAGNAGEVLLTINGGNTWTPVGGGAIGAADVFAINALDANTAFVTTTPGTATFIYRTTDGGATWTEVYTLAGGFINDIHMFDAVNGIAYGDPLGGKWVILRTSDGGASWSRIATEPNQIGAEAGFNNALAVVGTTHLWFGTSDSRIYRSTDGGTNWASSPTPWANSTGIWFNDLQNGFAGGTAAAGARSTDGGVTWTNVALTGAGAVTGVAGSQGNEFWVSKGPAVYRSSDGGATWVSSYASTVGNLRHLNFVTSGASSYGWAGSVSGGIASFFETGTAVEDPKPELPQSFALLQNYPNPFNPSTMIRFSLANRERVTLKILDVGGREVATLIDHEVLAAGEHSRHWEARNRASGIYFYRLATDNFQVTRKMILLQ